MQAALARSGGEHPTLVAVYVEEGSSDAAGVRFPVDRHHEALLLGCLETRPNRTQDANAQPPLTTTTTTAIDCAIPNLSILTPALSLRQAFYLQKLKQSSAHIRCNHSDLERRVL